MSVITNVCKLPNHREVEIEHANINYWYKIFYYSLNYNLIEYDYIRKLIYVKIISGEVTRSLICVLIKCLSNTGKLEII